MKTKKPTKRPVKKASKSRVVSTQPAEILLPALNPNSSVITCVCDVEVTRADVPAKILKTLPAGLEDIAETVVRCISLSESETRSAILHRYALGVEVAAVAMKYKDGGVAAIIRAMEAANPTLPSVKTYVYECYRVAARYTDEEIAREAKRGTGWRQLVDIASIESKQERRALLQKAPTTTVAQTQQAVQEAKQAEVAAAVTAGTETADDGKSAPAPVGLRTKLTMRLMQLSQKVEQANTVASTLDTQLNGELQRLADVDGKFWAETTVPRLKELRNGLLKLQQLPTRYLPVVDELLQRPVKDTVKDAAKDAAKPATSVTTLTTVSPHQGLPQRSRSSRR